MPHQQPDSGGGGGGGGGVGGPLADHPLNGVPEHWWSIIVHYVTGFHNITGKEFSDPIVKPALVNIYPLFVIQYALLAIFGVLANVYLIYYIMRYKLYRDVTHAFLMNLALCHFIQCGIVLPMTLMVIIIQNWIYGQFMCFFLPLLQDIPLHVAMISHLLIAWDRMRWLGDPLKIRLPSFVCSCATWLTGMVIALPYPIYTTYLDLGSYLPKFRGVGICVVNLVDDMQEYMRGLFVIMYCAPATILAYLYIRTSRELRPPEGPMGVMMFEHRAGVLNRQSTTSSTTPSATRTGTRTNYARSYDLYDAELDVTREKRTQRHLGAMAATQVICICPLMILRIARMVLVETYENTSHFDITYLMFVWFAFMPTFLNPCIYASWVLSRPMKERLRGYFRLSSRTCDKKPSDHHHHHHHNHHHSQHQRSSEVSMTQENTTETCDDMSTIHKFTEKSTDKYDKYSITKSVAAGARSSSCGGPSSIEGNSGTTKTTSINNSDKPSSIHKSNLKSSHRYESRSNSTNSHHQPLSAIGSIKGRHSSGIGGVGSSSGGGNEFSESLKERLAIAGLLDRAGSIDPLTNSCSNITSTTYCNGGGGLGTSGAPGNGVSGISGGGGDLYYEKNPLCDSLYSVATSTTDRKSNRSLYVQRCTQEAFSADLDNVMSRRESSSTYERDMEIIDLLERERSMDIQEMIERERRVAAAVVGSGDKGEQLQLQHQQQNSLPLSSNKISTSANRSISRQSSSFERQQHQQHRKLPDITRLQTTPCSPKKSNEFPNLVFTHQQSPHGRLSSTTSSTAAAASSNPTNGNSRPTSQIFYPTSQSASKRDSINSTSSNISTSGVRPSTIIGGINVLNDDFDLLAAENQPIGSSVGGGGGGGGTGGVGHRGNFRDSHRLGRTRSTGSSSSGGHRSGGGGGGGVTAMGGSIKSRGDRRLISCSGEFGDNTFSPASNL